MRLGIAWYREDQWNLLNSTAADPESLEDTYQDWLEKAINLMSELEKKGHKPIKVDFDVDKFNKWCWSNRKTPNGKARSEYVTHLLRTIDIFGAN